MRAKRSLPLAVIALAIFSLTGCQAITGPSLPDLVYVPDVEQPVPVNDLPESDRVENWIGRDQDGDAGGSCVHASIINCFRSAGRRDLEQRWYQNRGRGYEGPETAYRILDKLDAQGIPFAATEDADIELLEEASATRRQTAIFYYPSHCVNFQGFEWVNGEECAVLLDNNFRDRYIVVDRPTFERSWRYYGGFAVTPWIEPTTPRTFPRAVPRRSLYQ